MDKNVHFITSFFDTCHFGNKAWYILKLVLKELYIFASNVFKKVELCCFALLCRDAIYQNFELLVTRLEYDYV